MSEEATARELRTCADWALTVPHANAWVRECAERGWDVRGLVIAQIGLRLMNGLPMRVHALVEGDANYHNTRMVEHKSPSQYAAQVRDLVVIGLASIKIPLEIHTQVLPVQRVCWNGRALELAKERGEEPPAKDQITGVVVRFRVQGLGERLLVVEAEQ